MSKPATTTSEIAYARRRRAMSGTSANLRRSGMRLPSLEEIRLRIAKRMVDIACMFMPPVTVTVLVRHPGDDDADICITDDELPELLKMMARCVEREKRELELQRAK